MAWSSASTAISIIFSLFNLASSSISGLISTISKDAPKLSSFHIIDLNLTRSTTPTKSASLPIGIWITSGLAPNLSMIVWTFISKSAPILSILLQKQILGTLYLSACLQTVSDWGSTPATPSKQQTAPSKTLSERSTSIVKSTWPGVSIILILWSSQKHVVAAEVIVIPLSCSCSIQSIVAAPSWTSPILWDLPV